MTASGKKLGDAELEIMQALWAAGDAVTSGYVLEQLKGKRNWRLSTLMTTLSRLSDKGFVYCDRSTRTNMYTALVSEDEYRGAAGRSLFEKLYGSSVRSMVASLYDSKSISDRDLEELKNLIDELERRNSDG